MQSKVNQKALGTMASPYPAKRKVLGNMVNHESTPLRKLALIGPALKAPLRSLRVHWGSKSIVGFVGDEGKHVRYKEGQRLETEFQQAAEGVFGALHNLETQR